MKGILEFSLPEENEEFELAQNGFKYKIALDDMDNWLRGKIKYGDLDEKTHELYQECRDKLNSFLRDLE